MEAPFEEFLDLFLKEKTPIGSYWKHVLPFWKRSTESNVLFLKYEDMKKDLARVVRQCARFLNIDYEISDAAMKRLCQHLQFDSMQGNPAVNLEPLLGQVDINGNGLASHLDAPTPSTDSKFIRKGQVGDWKNYMSAEVSHRFDQWIEENTRGSGLSFQYE